MNGEKVMDHKDLEVWKKSIALVKKIYEISSKFPKEEKYSLTDQIRRCAVSIPSNIAEGSGRGSDKDFIRFLYIALGSLAETETQLIISERLKYLNEETVNVLLSELNNIKRMLLGLIKHLKDKSDD